MGKKRSDSFFWNYRICEYKNGSYSLNEVYYNKKGKPFTMTEKGVGFTACADEKPELIIEELEMALRDAKNYPVFKVPGKWQRIDSEKMKGMKK
jgi:hypothetical protein